MATSEGILNATIDLFREVGYNGTSVKKIVETSGTTTGSVYHFFPKGKDQLAAEAIRFSGPVFQQVLEGILDAAEDLAEGIYQVFEQANVLLQETGYIDPCPIGGVAREVASTKPELRAAVATVFRAWTAALGTRLQGAGLDPEHARDLSTATVAAIEGGFVLARTHQDQESLLSIGRTFRSIYASALQP